MWWGIFCLFVFESWIYVYRLKFVGKEMVEVDVVVGFDKMYDKVEEYV